MNPDHKLKVATGPGPRWLRVSLAVLATMYYAALLEHPPMTGWFRPVAFFTYCTKLFPKKMTSALEFRLEAWSCERRDWVPLDPRPYFPIEADDKESRFQRLGYFYHHNREVMESLDDYIQAHHASTDDGAPGPIGGIRVVQVNRPLPAVGDPVERYAYRPLSPAPADQRKDQWWTRQSVRKARCEAAR